MEDFDPRQWGLSGVRNADCTVGRRTSAALAAGTFGTTDSRRHAFSVNGDGKPWSKQSHYSTTRKLLADAGLDGNEGGTFKLRHTFAMRQLRRGTLPAEVPRWLGVEVEVMDRYKHVVSGPMDVV